MPLPAARFPCCRAHDLSGPVEPYAHSIRRDLADEAYWFSWSGSCHGSATVRFARLGNDAMFGRIYRSSEYHKPRRAGGGLSMLQWALIEDAVIAAGFWMLPRRDAARHGLDGADWMIAGRRGRDYRVVARWSPDGALYDLGRLMFDLAGLADVKL